MIDTITIQQIQERLHEIQINVQSGLQQ
jgi:hypothetical protein